MYLELPFTPCMPGPTSLTRCYLTCYKNEHFHARIFSTFPNLFGEFSLPNSINFSIMILTCSTQKIRISTGIRGFGFQGFIRRYDKNMPCGPFLFRWVDMKPKSYMVKDCLDFLEQPDTATSICDKDVYIYVLGR